MPQGAAQQVNQALEAVPAAAPAPPEQAAEQPPEGTPFLGEATLPGPQLATSTDFTPQPRTDETGQLLFGQGGGLRPRGRRMPPPEEVLGWLPALAQAATAPGAHPGLRALVQAVLDAVDEAS